MDDFNNESVILIEKNNEIAKIPLFLKDCRSLCMCITSNKNL